MVDGNKATLGETKKSFFDEIAALTQIDSYSEAFGKLNSQVTGLNNRFLESRQRIVEMNVSISDALPRITRLGGSISDVSETIGDIAAAARRNVIANTETIEKVFAASKIIGTDAETLTKSFVEVGFGMEQIGENVEKSINYVQSIGLNARTIFRTVLDNTEKLQRFNFENGIIGLTKMAAQANMLRFDMNQTFTFADQVLDPENAVKMASAFQRLGVTIGNLVDPFQLMNLSINDPSGLQDSLIKVADQFTYFDEKTKTFQINRQGILTMRELARETGLSADELQKAALAKAELDARLSQISPTIKFDNEEDKQYLANISRMGASGKYEVQVGRDEKGEMMYKDLTQVTQEEIKELIKIQKERPKTLEDIQRNSFDLTKLIQGDVRAMAEKIVYGVVSAPTLTEFTESMRGVANAVGGTLSQGDRYFGVQNVRRESEEFFKNSKEILEKVISGQASFSDFGDYLEKNAEQIKNISKGFGTEIERFTKEVSEKLPDDKNIGGFAKEQAMRLSSWLSGQEAKVNANQPLTQTVTGDFISTPSNTTGIKNFLSGTLPTKSNLDVNGQVEIKIVLPDNFNTLSKEQQDQLINKLITDPALSKKIEKIYKDSTTNYAPKNTAG